MTRARKASRLAACLLSLSIVTGCVRTGTASSGSDPRATKPYPSDSRTDGAPTASVNVKLRPGANATELASRHHADKQSAVESLPGWHVLTFADSRAAQAALSTLSRDPEVECAELNRKQRHVLRTNR